MTDRRMARTWAEIDLDALAHNYRLLRGLAPEARFLGLVKANAYGHGAVPVAKKLERLGADMLAVACLDEAIELREAGVEIPILCLGQTAAEYASDLLAYNITQTVGDLETGRALSAAAVVAGKTLTIHVKVDTGMGRLGFVWAAGREADSAREIAALCVLPGLEAEGIFTHFSDADGSWEYTRTQNRRFGDVIEVLRRAGQEFKICHCAASAAVLNYPYTSMDMIRPGISLYGCCPAPGMDNPGLKPVMTVKSRISAVRTLPAGSFISYGRTAALHQISRLAVIPIGYGDGYPRVLSNQMDMLIRGVPCPIVGRICMDMCMVDVTGLENVQPGEAAVIYGPKLTQRAAKLAGTIPYELLCQLTPRVPRLYFEDGREISE